MTKGIEIYFKKGAILCFDPKQGDILIDIDDEERREIVYLTRGKTLRSLSRRNDGVLVDSEYRFHKKLHRKSWDVVSPGETRYDELNNAWEDVQNG